MDGAALDRPRTDERHLHGQIVEVLGPRAKQALHLRPALDLEDAHGVRLVDLAVDGRVVERDPGEVDRLAGGAWRSCSTHSSTAESMPRPSRSIFRKPGVRRRSPCPTGRAGGPPSRPGSTGTSSTSGRDEMTMPPGCWETWRGRPAISPQSSTNARQRGARSLAAGVREVGELLPDGAGVPSLGDACETLELGRRQPERLADLADRATRAVGGERGDECCVLAAVALCDAPRSASRGCHGGNRGRYPEPRRAPG